MRASIRPFLAMLLGGVPPVAATAQVPVTLGVQVTDVGGSNRVTWKPVRGTGEYSVERWMLSQPDCCRTTSGIVLGSSWTDAPMTLAGTYVYRVTVRFADGKSGHNDLQVNWSPVMGKPAGAAGAAASGASAAAGAAAGGGAPGTAGAAPAGSAGTASMAGAGAAGAAGGAAPMAGSGAAGAAAGAAAEPANPIGFTASQIGEGVVRLSWQPVRGAVGYVVSGPGVPRGSQSITEAIYTAVKVPAGMQRWLVGSVSAAGTTSAAAVFTVVTLSVVSPFEVRNP